MPSTGKCTQSAFVCGRYLFKQIKLLARKIPRVGAERSEKSELKPVQSAFKSDLLTTSATHGTFSRPSTKYEAWTHFNRP